MANGYAMAAVLGVEKVMQAAQTTFISSTNWTERVGPTAAIATIKKLMNNNVYEHLIEMGNSVKKVWKDKADKHGLAVHISGLPTLCHMKFIGEGEKELATYLTIRLLSKGFLGYRQFKPSYAHSKTEIDLYSEAIDEIFSDIKESDPKNLLSTPVAHDGFARLTAE